VSERPAEITQFHCRLMKCTLEIDNSRAYWQHVGTNGSPPTARRAFEEYWFGARSLPRAEMLMAHLRTRYDAYPSALEVLKAWRDMDPDTRRLVCHWHLQLADPLYRTFTGRYLVSRREEARAEVTRGLVVTWVEQQAPGRWMMPTKLKFASKLLQASLAAGLVASARDPRPLCYPRVSDEALTYLMYLLRNVEFAGTLLDNPYAASVGLQGSVLEQRLRGLTALRFYRQGELVDFGWCHSSLADWASATVLAAPTALPEGNP
jgi:hypothetical protein